MTVTNSQMMPCLQPNHNRGRESSPEQREARWDPMLGCAVSSALVSAGAELGPCHTAPHKSSPVHPKKATCDVCNLLSPKSSHWSEGDR